MSFGASVSIAAFAVNRGEARTLGARASLGDPWGQPAPSQPQGRVGVIARGSFPSSAWLSSALDEVDCLVLALYGIGNVNLPLHRQSLRKSKPRLLLDRHFRDRHGLAPDDARRKTMESVLRKMISTDKNRDEGVKNLANSPQWFELLPDVIEPEKADRPIRVISPEEYLALATGEVEDENLPPATLVVDGDFVLCQKREVYFLSGKKVARGGSDPLTSLPPAVIRGDLRITGAKDLQEINCFVTGDTTLQNCRSLKKIQGECFGSVKLVRCGPEHLAALYRCAGNMWIEGCKNLKVVNCEVGGNLTVSSSPLERTGGGMQVGGDFYVMGRGLDLKVRGRVGGCAIHGGVELPVGASLDDALRLPPEPLLVTSRQKHAPKLKRPSSVAVVKKSGEATI